MEKNEPLAGSGGRAEEEGLKLRFRWFISVLVLVASLAAGLACSNDDISWGARVNEVFKGSPWAYP